MRIIISILLVLLPLTSAVADSWMPPSDTEIGSSDGRYLVRITPGQGDGAQATFLVAGEHVADVALQNEVAPVEGLVSTAGYLILFDNWYRVGYGTVVAIYDPKGALIADYQLEQLYSDAQLAQVPLSVSSRWWRCGEAEWEDAQLQTRVLVAEFSGGRFLFNLSDGGFSYESGSGGCR